MSITWSKYFDKIYCINFIEYTQRKKLMQTELKRVGILDSGIFKWYITYGNNMNKAFQKCIYNSFETIHKWNPWTNVSAMLGHLNCIREALSLGYEHILILEDDARFLKDLNRIEEVLDHRPEDYNIILYDKMLINYTKKKQFQPINEYFSTFNYLFSAGCYELDRKGMQKLIQLLETMPQPIDNFFGQMHKELGDDIKTCCSNTNLAIQIVFSDANNLLKIFDNVLEVQNQYKYLDIKFDDYMMNSDSSSYYYGDLIPIEKEKRKYNSLFKLTKDITIDSNQQIKPIEMNICMGVLQDEFDRILPVIYTLRKYSESKINFHIIVDSNEHQYFYDHVKRFTDDKTTFTFYNDDIIRNNLNMEYNIKKHMYIPYLKLVIPSLFPQYDKMLYLDYDILIKNKGIEWLYNLDLKDNYLAAGKDIIDEFTTTIYPPFRQQNHYFKIKNKNKYFNNGVILYNNKKIIEDKIDEVLMDLLRVFQTNHTNDLLSEYYRYKFLDMLTSETDTITFNFNDKSLLNYAFMNKPVLIVNPIFNNLQTHKLYGSDTIITNKNLKERWDFEDEQELVDKTIIVHYMGQKPWWRDLDENIFTTDYQQQLFNYYDEVIKEMEQKHD